MQNEGVKERLVAFLADIGWSQSKFERECGMSNGYVNNIRQSIQPDKLQRIAQRFPALNISWLLIGDSTGEEMYRIPRPKELNTPENKLKGIPMIPLEAFASPGEPNYDDIHVLDYYMVDEFKDCDFVIRIKGDSMTPRYASGDVVACKKIVEMLYFQWGRVYVLYTQSNGLMIKRIQPSEKEDCIKCVSDNGKYAPFDVPRSDIVSLALVNGLVSLE
ncbi:MAG: hypothetical protein IKR38_03035 [Bacteroidales bacterium]|nr:hypothetical protein [Bacteroidales bacterium]